jgi:RNA polymerase sigma-70 factor (sigma-E family)
MEQFLAQAPAAAAAGDPDDMSASAPGGSASTPGDAAAAVTALYREHAVGLIRLAHVMLGSRAAAEDVVQEAFCGLYRRWQHLSGADKALSYLRSSVLNGCRSALRRNAARDRQAARQPPLVPAESAVLPSEERRWVIDALRRLPDRQREALVLHFYLDLPDDQIASYMGISKSTVRSTTRRAIAALGIVLKETS